jgi:hypothetical protein
MDYFAFYKYVALGNVKMTGGRTSHLLLIIVAPLLALMRCPSLVSSTRYSENLIRKSTLGHFGAFTFDVKIEQQIKDQEFHRNRRKHAPGIY